ncbi:hypothetical protein [Bacillus sp. FJAT-50079]|uniref:hypothetical protein n=1 Tax=Bacillus sp. FJAT-50079 TaxID=2833577 RepID=UPI001BC93DB4|nr:hypothetical protein [Bacillus sp. FJAT-50079]MBS4210376.1 hypothetical protein [Bacillus sp. FJAT-50079]
MRKAKTLNRIAALIALFFIFIQTFALPVMAAQPWTGNSWNGNSWQGNPWDAGDLTWEGNSWQGNSWSESSSQGGNDWNGTTWSSTPWYMNPWLHPGFNGGPGYDGTPWNTPGFNGGPGYNGTPWNTPGFNGGPGYDGNAWNTPGFNGGLGYDGTPWNTPGSMNGVPWNAPGYSGGPWNLPGYNGLPPWMFGGLDQNGNRVTPAAPRLSGDQLMGIDLPYGYEVGKYVGSDIIGGQVGMIGDFLDPGNHPLKVGSSFATGLFLNGVKVGLGDKAPWYIDGAIAAKDTYDYTKTGILAGKDFLTLKGVIGTSQAGARGSVSSLSTVGAISKFNVAASAIGAGFAAFETGFKTGKAVDVIKSDAQTSQKVSAVADATSSLGETLFHAGTVAAAIPGGQTAGAVLIAGGAVIWGASRLTKLVADNWGSIKAGAKALRDGAKAGAKALVTKFTQKFPKTTQAIKFGLKIKSIFGK